jgi:uncharacterized protein with GYD domain
LLRVVQVAYSSSGMGGLVKEPQNRIEKVTPAIESMDGRVESAYYAFGEHDVILICEMPDNVSAAAFALAVSSGGTVGSYRTTVLLTADTEAGLLELGLAVLRARQDLNLRPLAPEASALSTELRAPGEQG